MAGLLSVADALAQVLEGAAPLSAIDVPLSEAHGRVLAPISPRGARSRPHAMSAMDGYAVRAADVKETPARLTIIGEVAAGRPFGRAVGKGEAARIFTGGVVPDGADTVVIQENTRRDGDIVTVNSSAALGKNIRPGGLDFKEGEVLFKRGHRLLARDLALVAGMNYASVPVHRTPRIASFATGDELVPPGSTARAWTDHLLQRVHARRHAARRGRRGDRSRHRPGPLDDTVAAVRKAKAVEAPISW